jgi:hypothetical protein
VVNLPEAACFTARGGGRSGRRAPRPPSPAELLAWGFHHYMSSPTQATFGTLLYFLPYSVRAYSAVLGLARPYQENSCRATSQGSALLQFYHANVLKLQNGGE